MKIFAIILSIVLIAPSVFFITPQKTHAQYPTIEVPGTLTFQSTITAIKSTLSTVLEASTEAAVVAQYINTYYLQPLAFIMSGNLMKLLTASVLDFVIGKTNGTGAPQFVQDLNGNLQRVGDIQANAFFVQFGRNSNSPFASAISSSLRTNYLWNTSSAGFFAQNRNTMSQYSPNVNSFLNGDWSQGGVGAWFALTTQTQNNPYTFYQASQSHLASVVASAQEARRAVLDWSQGFLSWCGASEVDTTASNDGTEMEGINPGDACTNADGTPGTIKTPGSTIKATLDKVLGGTQDKLVQIGSLAKEVNGILGNVATVLGTVQFASDILGGSNSGGLFGVGQTSATNPTSRLLQYQSPGYLGVTESQVNKNAATLPVSGPDMLSRVAQYESSWNSIRGAANSASTTVASLASFCTTASNSQSDYPDFLSASATQASEARLAITTQIAPIFAQADVAFATITTARAMVQKIQIELNSGSVGVGSAYATDVITLQTMSPSASDVSMVQQEVQAFNMATAIPSGSLTVSGGSIIDRMSLISTNAEALKASVCEESVYRSNNNNSSD
jgi:hypothetical protein